MSAPRPARGAPQLALVTAVYPGVEPYLADFHRSVRAQLDRDFDLWIAHDGLDPGAVESAGGEPIDAQWVAAEPGDTPALVRQRVLEVVVDRYDGVVMVDADDRLHPSRVAAARRSLTTADVTACALRLVDARGADLEATFAVAPGVPPEATLPRTNVFGLSNTAYRSTTLRGCLPLPAGARAVDWFLATRAWLAGARLDLDPVPRMDYRQHGANITVVRPPIRAEHVRRDAAIVAAHLALVAAEPGAGPDPSRLAALTAFATEVDEFRRRVVGDPGRLARYVERLGRVGAPTAWWGHVAHSGAMEAVSRGGQHRLSGRAE